MNFEQSLRIGMFVSAMLAGSVAAAEPPQWIWGNADAATSAPAGKVYFRRTFEVEKPDSVRVDITCDENYTLYVNRRPVGKGSNWGQLDAYEIKSFLRPGKNCLAVVGQNGEGPGALAAKVVVKSGEQATELSTGTAWKFSLQAPDGWNALDFDDSGWKAAFALGELGKSGPWGDKVQAARDVQGPPDFVVKERPAGKFQLLDGDRVVFVGDTLIEREQNSSYLETALTARYPKLNVIYRNLGWSGDTVFGDARAGFGTAADGFEQLRQQVYTLKPTVIFVGYGGNSSFDGKAGLQRFIDGYHTLLDMLEVTQAEFVLLSPIRHEDMGRPLPDPKSHNESLELYTHAIERIAKERKHRFVDLFHTLKAQGKQRLTENGVHPSEYGYWRIARHIEQSLGLESPQEVATFALEAAGGKGNKAKGELSYLRGRLPESPLTGASETGLRVKITGLSAGKHTLKVDGEPVHTATAQAWAKGELITTGPEVDQVEALRQTIIAKNLLYFYRWRPQNETYLFGFRKHEQGQNAKEVPMFDPLVSEQEARIAELRVPAAQKYEIVEAK